MPLETDNVLAAKGFLLAPLCLALLACTAGDGEGLDANGQPIPIGPAPASEFQRIQDTIFTPICTQCHIGANAPQGMRLDAANSYAMIVGVASNEVPSLMRINPGNPDASYLVQKIQGNAAQGVRMPANGPPYLSQEQIDLVRSWVAAGAPPASAAPNNLVVTSSVPASGEVAAAGLDRLTVVFAGDVDASLAASGTFELRDGFDQPVALASVHVPQGRPRVVELTPARVLPPGSYQLEIRGQGPVALADTAGHVLDGDADGTAGGDFLMSFDVSAGASR
jgi:mono/diheme cytochrome c family protein